MSTDIALSYDRNAVFILGGPNQGNRNVIKANNQLTDKELALSLPRGKLIDAVTIPNKDKIILKNGDTDLLVTGENLVGEFVLRKGKDEAVAPIVRVKPSKDGLTSDLTEVKIAFLKVKLNVPVGKGYELLLRSAAGESNILKGFEVK